eukprot:scaffold1991_cov111-Isochrysis_galbana.AAC.2
MTDETCDMRYDIAAARAKARPPAAGVDASMRAAPPQLRQFPRLGAPRGEAATHRTKSASGQPPSSAAVEAPPAQPACTLQPTSKTGHSRPGTSLMCSRSLLSSDVLRLVGQRG